VTSNGHENSGGPLVRLIDEIGQAARAGWGNTSRMVVLLAAGAGAIALIVMAGR
jgi:hypothetical protein